MQSDIIVLSGSRLLLRPCIHNFSLVYFQKAKELVLELIAEKDMQVSLHSSLEASNIILR